MAANNSSAEVSSISWASAMLAQNSGCRSACWRNIFSKIFSTNGLSSTTNMLRTASFLLLGLWLAF